MDFDSLSKDILNQLEERMKNHKGLAIFASERAKFEGWLKVELCGILSNSNVDEIKPESDHFDVVFDGCAIELKTINTNYRYAEVKNKHRPITKNIEGLIKDIEKLKKSNFENKIILFIAFPAEHNHTSWQKQLSRLGKELELEHREFKFNNDVPGVIYCGRIRAQ